MPGHFYKGWLLFALMQGLLLTLLLPSAIQAEDIYDQVKSDIRAERTQAALKTLSGMVKKRPDDFHAWFLYGVASAHLKHYHRSIEAFRHVINLNPKLAEPHDNLAVIYNELGDVPAAVRELEQSLVKRPDNPVAEENLADLYVKMALKRYRSALERQPTRQLEKRYSRLLQVRDPDVASGRKEEQSIASLPVEIVQEESAATVDVVMEEPRPVDSEMPITEQAAKEAAELSAMRPMEEVTKALPLEQKAPLKLLESQVLAAVEAWRVAWSARSLPDYFAAYAKGFEVPDRFKSRQEWQSYKQRVISSKSYIEIEISDIHVELEQGEKLAHVNFFQKFRSNSYNGDGSKVLTMRLDNGAWKILREDSAS